MNVPIDILARVTAQQAPPSFGAPFTEAFAKIFEGKATEDSFTAAGIICALYLSAAHEAFPTAKLNLYTRNVRDEVPLFAFDCKSYEKLFLAIGEREHTLLGKDMQERTVFITKQEILEAFDFITNI